MSGGKKGKYNTLVVYQYVSIDLKTERSMGSCKRVLNLENGNQFALILFICIPVDPLDRLELSDESVFGKKYIGS